MEVYRYMPSSIRNQTDGVAPTDRYIPDTQVGRAWAAYQDREWVEQQFELYRADYPDDYPVDTDDYPEGWIAQWRCRFSEHACPSVAAYNTEAEALAAGVKELERWGYSITDRAEADRLSAEHARERCRAAQSRTALRRRMLPLLERHGAEELARRLGVQRNHVGNLVKFIRGKKPDVPGESLDAIAAVVDAAESLPE